MPSGRMPASRKMTLQSIASYASSMRDAARDQHRADSRGWRRPRWAGLSCAARPTTIARMATESGDLHGLERRRFDFAHHDEISVPAQLARFRPAGPGAAARRRVGSAPCRSLSRSVSLRRRSASTMTWYRRLKSMLASVRPMRRERGATSTSTSCDSLFWRLASFSANSARSPALRRPWRP